jgi:hypothetical protein
MAVEEGPMSPLDYVIVGAKVCTCVGWLVGFATAACHHGEGCADDLRYILTLVFLSL